MCWWYRKYAGEQSPVDQKLYEAAETKAKEQAEGLWVDPGPGGALGVAETLIRAPNAT